MGKEKNFVAPRCIHMPAADNTVIIFSSKKGETYYEAGFTIGNQDFTVAERGTKAEAQWYCAMLEMAFKDLITPKSLKKLKSEEPEKLMKNSCYPQISVTNLE
ncbi:MAG: hypothetical protein V4608_03280 [Bacteroidota bacterium]